MKETVQAENPASVLSGASIRDYAEYLWHLLTSCVVKWIWKIRSKPEYHNYKHRIFTGHPGSCRLNGLLTIKIRLRPELSHVSPLFVDFRSSDVLEQPCFESSVIFAATAFDREASHLQ